MSRSGYSDDCENLWLWRGAVTRSINGERGQRFLKELAVCMDAMPKKELITGELITQKGECCTIGVYCKSKNIPIDEVDLCDPQSVGNAVGIAQAMAAEIEYFNDEMGDHSETPEERWVRMREWVRDNLKGVLK